MHGSYRTFEGGACQYRYRYRHSGKEKAGLNGPATLLEGSVTDIANWEGYYPG